MFQTGKVKNPSKALPHKDPSVQAVCVLRQVSTSWEVLTFQRQLPWLLKLARCDFLCRSTRGLLGLSDAYGKVITPYHCYG